MSQITNISWNSRRKYSDKFESILQKKGNPLKYYYKKNSIVLENFLCAFCFGFTDFYWQVIS